MSDISTPTLKVLLIEDNPADARLMQVMLANTKGAAVTCEWVPDLTTGLERLTTAGIDVVLLDLSLPDSRGLETFARVHEQAAHLPIIVLTGFDDEALAIRAVQVGAQDYLAKGNVNGPLLLRAMRYAIERKKTQEQLARYARELRARNAEMLEELIMAREIQQAFVPQQYPCFPPAVHLTDSAWRFGHRYLPTTTLGGDFFDIEALSATEAAVFISDVMGHGVRAALVTAILRGLVEELRGVARDPGRFLMEINRGLQDVLSHAGTPMFTSAFYLVADAATGQMQYASAGHPSPMCLRRDAGLVETLPFPPGATGPALGLFADSTYATGASRLNIHDRLVLFTDGLYEVPDAAGEDYGQERLLAATRHRLHRPTPQLFDELLADARQFSAKGEFIDDVCLVGMELARLCPAA